MAYPEHTRRERSFDEWLADCSSWCDLIRGEEAYEHPGLDWEAWYAQGLTVEQAVRRADACVFGGPAD